MSNPLRINSITIDNIKGVEHIEFPLSSLTVIQGANGTGKTSILDGIRAFFDGGHDPSLIRNGADKGVVVFDLNNGTRMKRTITPKTSSLDITTVDGLKVKSPAAFVEKLAAGFSYDVLGFLDADPKKRLAFLLEAMPITFLADEVAAITGKPFPRDIGIEEMNQLRAGIYEERRTVNVAMKELDGTIASMMKALPPDDGEDWPAKAAELAESKTLLTAEVEKVKGNIRAELLAAMRDVNKTRDDAIAAANAAHAEAQRELEALAHEAETTQLAEISAELQTVAAELATAEAKRREQDRSIDAKRQVKTFRDRSAEKQSAVNAMTAQLEKLDELKKKVLADAAIPGIDMTADGKIMVDGVDLDNLNTQRQYVTAFQIATLKHGDLGFMICDRSESIVGEDWTDFQAAAVECGFQVLVARSEAGAPLNAEVIA